MEATEQYSPLPSAWQVHNRGFNSIIGANPSLELILSVKEYPFAHEAGVFIPSTDELFITSTPFRDSSSAIRVQISKVTLGDRRTSPTHTEIDSDEIYMGNGGVNDDAGDGILFCAQGSLTRPSGLFRMSRTPPYRAEPVITSFYGRPFNSVNDVVIHRDGSIWFTDPCCGYDQGCRPSPSLPNQVYRFDPKTLAIRAMADGFGRPNGICFSPDESIVYITDTDAVHGHEPFDGSRASSMLVHITGRCVLER